MTQSSNSSSVSPAARVVLLGSVFLVAACGLVYELVAGAVSSYIMGDAVTQFSLVIGVFLCAMGLGSYLAKYARGDLLKTFLEVEIVIGLIGGLSSIAMFAVSAYMDPVFPVIFKRTHPVFRRGRGPLSRGAGVAGHGAGGPAGDGADLGRRRRSL